MLWTPRPYQQSAIDAVFDYWDAAADPVNELGGNPLIVIPTGGGKAGVLGTITRRLIDQYPGMRIINVTHSAELVGQNYEELIGMWDWAPAGVYQAQLGRRDTRQQILFCGIQSIWNKVDLLGEIDLVIIDEAHAVPRNDSTMYGKFLAAVRDGNPHARLLGLTATDYRLDSGRLTEGDDKLFDDVAYEVNIRELMDDGYLTPLTSKATQTALSTNGVKKTGGDFNAKALQAAVDKDELNRAIVAEAMSYGNKRRSWLGFASGVEHAHHLAEITREHGITSAVLDGTTPPGERKQMIADFKAMRIRCLWNCGVLTTGFNAPAVDMIIAARPTESAGLYVQIAGRGTRNCYASGMPLDTREQRLAAIAQGPKPNCLFLDFGGLVQRHGPVDMVTPRRPGKGGGDAPVKTCPPDKGGCSELVHASVMVCPECGYEWERHLSAKITKSAAVTPILSKSDAVWRKVDKRRFSRHEKFGGNPSVKVEYHCGSAIFPEWIAFESDKGRFIAERWWRKHGGAEPVPETVSEALKRAEAGELKPVEEIRIKAEGRYWRVDGQRFGGDATDEVDKPAPAEKWVFGGKSGPRLVPVDAGNLAGMTGRAKVLAKPLILPDEEVPF